MRDTRELRVPDHYARVTKGIGTCIALTPHSLRITPFQPFVAQEKSITIVLSHQREPYSEHQILRARPGVTLEFRLTSAVESADKAGT